MNKIINNKRLLRFFLLCLLSVSPALYADDCLHFRVVGICIWIWPYPLDINVTIKLGHFNPDVIVFVDRKGFALSSIQDVQTYGAEDPKRIDTHNRNHDNLMYKEALATGNPLAGQIYCPTQSETTIYFESELDIPSWKWGGLDTFDTASWLPGEREIEDGSNNWGALYPRTGWTIQHSDPKTAGIIAQRVGDIITRESEPHIYNDDLGSAPAIFVDDEKFTWAPRELLENTNEEGWWEPIAPEFSIDCDVFGESGTDDDLSEEGDYTYILWRPYTCCEIEAGFLIYIDFMSYP